MKLYILKDKALLMQGKNRAKVCVIRDGKVLETDGLLQIGGVSVSIEAGYGVLPPLPCGNSCVAFVDTNGNKYEGGVVKITKDLGIQNTQETLDFVLTEATKIQSIEKQIAEIKDTIIEITGKIDYRGLDFLLEGE